MSTLHSSLQRPQTGPAGLRGAITAQTPLNLTSSLAPRLIRALCSASLALANAAGCRGQPQAVLVRPRVSVIDIHTHLGGVEEFPGKTPNFPEIQRAMQDHNVELVVDFKAPDNSLANGVFGERVMERLAIYPDTARFKLFANIPIDGDRNLFLGESRPDYPQWIAQLLEDAVRHGASGLKAKVQAGDPLRKANGEIGRLSYWTYDSRGTLISFDTAAFDPLWAAAERLRIPVIVHLGGTYKGDHQEPKGADRGARWEMLMLQRERVLRRHPHLLYIGAHWGSCSGDRTYLEEVLARYPNFVVEGGAHAPDDEYASLDPAELAFFERFQDQLLFGTDYMENTMGWLKSYGQRLDMYLPYTEAWPLADSVREKYYHGNARRLLHRARADSAPVTHPGFTATHLVGERVTLDGSGSFDLAGDSIRYAWTQLAGPAARLSSPTAARPQFDAREEGTYTFSLTTSTARSRGRSRSVMVNVVRDSGFFAEDSGRVVIEAEHYWTNTPRLGQRWTAATAQAGYSGDAYLVAGPERGTTVDWSFHERAPELRYKIWVSHPGTYVVYVRGFSPDSAANSVHVGLDNEEARLADKIGAFPLGQWNWVRDTREWDAQFHMLDRNLAVLNIAEAGPHILNVWMHRDGFMLDELLLVHQDHAEVSFPLVNPAAAPALRESRRLTARRVSR